MGLALGITLKFYISVVKGLKLKVAKFCGLSPLFVEIKVWPNPLSPFRPSWIRSRKQTQSKNDDIMQKNNFIGILEGNEREKMFFIIKNPLKETTFNFSRNAEKAMNKMKKQKIINFLNDSSSK